MPLHFLECGRINRHDISWSCETCRKSDDSEEEDSEVDASVDNDKEKIDNDNKKSDSDNDHDSGSDINQSR